MNNFNGLGQINLELSSRCNKNCHICGRRQHDRLYGTQNYGDMPFDVVQLIASQVPSNIMVAFHNNGEGLLYPEFGKAVNLFSHCITYIVTNGLLIVDKADEIINNLDIMSISIIENEDPIIKKIQKRIISDFLEIKGDRKPNVTLRFVGTVDEEYYKEFDLMKVRRVLHIPDGSRKYTRPPTIPEHGVCQDLLNRLAIDRYGNVSMCVRFDPEGELRLGNIQDDSLIDLWNCDKRQWTIKKMVDGKRSMIPYCGDKCEFWGVPTA